MSSASRAPGDKKPEADEPVSKRPASPGRYSLSTEGSTEMAAVRIDSTRMPAVRPEGAAATPPRLTPQSLPLPSAVNSPTAATPSAVAPAPPITVPPPSGAPPPLTPGGSRRGTLPQGVEAVSPARAPSASALPAVDHTPHSQPPTKGTGAAALANAAPLSSPPPSMRPDHSVKVPPPAARPAPPPPPAPAPAARSLTPPPRSLRPPPPPSKRDSGRPPPGPSTFPGFDEGSILDAFDGLLSEGTEGVAGRDANVDLAPVRELFAELAANHMRHVRDFMIDVKWGEAPRQWIEICIPAVASLRRAAERLELTELALGLDGFAAELRATTADAARTIAGATKDRLLDRYGQLVAILPQAFALDRDKSQREAVIIQSLCLSVPDVRKVTIDKLLAAGLTSLKMLFDAKPEEIAQVAGIPEPLAVRIVERFQAYRSELQNAAPQDARAAERERLAGLMVTLREQHDGYEEASRGWSPEAKGKKRELFRLREENWLAVSLLLARFGEVERLQGIEKLPFAQRIAQLTEYLEEARQKYRAD